MSDEAVPELDDDEEDDTVEYNEADDEDDLADDEVDESDDLPDDVDPDEVPIYPGVTDEPKVHDEHDVPEDA